MSREAYERLGKLAEYADVEVPVALSLLSSLLDRRLPAEHEREGLIREYETYLKENPKGLQT